MSWGYRFWSNDPRFFEFCLKISSSTVGLDAPEEIAKRLEEYYKSVDEKEREGALQGQVIEGAYKLERSTDGFIEYLEGYGYHVEVIELEYAIEWSYKDRTIERTQPFFKEVVKDE